MPPAMAYPTPSPVASRKLEMANLAALRRSPNIERRIWRIAPDGDVVGHQLM
jgi:hypothetical protein